MTDLDLDEYDWRRLLSHINMTGGALGKYGFVAVAAVTTEWIYCGI